MRRLVFVALALTLISTPAWALTAAQLTTLRNDINANVTAIPAALVDCGGYVGVQVKNVPNNTDGNICLARFYNQDSSPAFIVWKTSVPLVTVGQTFNATELAGLTSLNTQRLQNLAAWLTTGVNPALTSVRQFFDDIFSGAGGTNTRAALLALWKRTSTRAERLYATGTGSDASPGQLVFEGGISGSDVDQARAN